MNDIGLELLDASDGRARLLQFFDSRAWWIIIPGDQAGARGAEDALAAAGDGEVLAVPTPAGVLMVVFIRKDRLAWRDIKRISKLAPLPDDVDGGERDVLLFAEEAHLAIAVARAQVLQHLMDDARGERPPVPETP